MMMYLFLGQFSKCGLFMTHTEVILACDDGSELFYSAAQGEMGDWFYCCSALDEARRQAAVCVIIG